jgi:cyclic di-GMP phosphodiesterase
MNSMENKKWKILVVDDEPVNLQILRQILKKKYQIVFARSGEEALQVTSKHNLDLILLDVMMPKMDGYEVCRQLKANKATEKIPVIFVTALDEDYEDGKGFDLGAVDYITKPVKSVILLSRVENHLTLAHQQRSCEKLVERRTADLRDSHRAAINMLSEAGHYNDTDTGVHIWRMASYCAAIARAAVWNTQDVKLIELAAPMHDTGKIGISDSILRKPGKLNSEEWEIMRKHTFYGYEILSKSDSPLFKMAAEIALYHHEKWNGTGYPKGLKGNDITESARIVAIADVFDALTMKRPYKEPWTIEDAFAEIKKGQNTHFDPHLVDLFFEIEPEIRSIKDSWDKKTEMHKNNTI